MIARKDIVPKIITEIERKIGTGQLVPGQRLTEPDIAEMFDVSRVPAREALRVLAGEGLIEIVRGKGARIKQANTRTVCEMVKVLTALTSQAVREFLENRPGPDAIGYLNTLTEQVMIASEDEDQLGTMRCVGRYQWHIMKLSENVFLQDAVRRMHLNIYFAHLIEVAGADVIRRCARRYPLFTDALSRGDVCESVEIVEWFGRSLLDAIARNDRANRIR